jgi:hypothetical protein
VSLRSARPNLSLVLPLLAALFLGGCASDEFTLEADLPGDFALTGHARYSVAEGSRCGAAPDESLAQRIFATSGHAARPHRVSYQIPLRLRSNGCTRVLSHILIKMDGDSAPPPAGKATSDISFANLSIVSQLPRGSTGMPRRGARIFDGLCRWRPSPWVAGGRELECRASDIDGRWLEGRPGGSLLRDELPGRTVRLAIGMAPDVPATTAGE